MDAPVPKKWHTREDSGLRLDAELRWWHDDELVEHPNIIEAFNRGLRVEPDGRVTLHFGNDWCFVQVADAVFKVVAVDESDGERLSVRLSDRTAEWLDVETLAVDEEGVLFVRVKEKRAKAKFSRDAQFQLAERLERGANGLVLRVGSRLVPTPLPSSVIGE